MAEWKVWLLAVAFATIVFWAYRLGYIRGVDDTNKWWVEYGEQVNEFLKKIKGYLREKQGSDSK